MKKLKLSTWAAIVVAACVANSNVKAENILGIDVSSYQGSINWTDVHNAGVDFAFVKATEGYDYYEDPDYASNMANGKAAGVQMGAYEFSHCYANTPAQEATYFWNYAGGYIKADGKSIDPMIDFEVFDGHDSTSTYTAWFNDWATDVKAKTSSFMRPVIYCSAGTGACDLNTSIALSAFIADYNGENLYTGGPWSCCTSCNAWDVDGTGNWTYWQCSSTGSIPGISGDVDLDAYPDSLADLKAYQGVGE
jgi:lysozyme